MTSQLFPLIGRIVAVNTTSAAAALAAWTLVAGLAPVSGQVVPPQDRVSQLIDRHGCWSGTAPEGAAAPTHAVVTGTDGRTRLVDARVGYDIWLEDAEGTVHAFCP